MLRQHFSNYLSIPRNLVFIDIAIPQENEASSLKLSLKTLFDFEVVKLYDSIFELEQNVHHLNIVKKFSFANTLDKRTLSITFCSLMGDLTGWHAFCNLANPQAKNG